MSLERAIEELVDMISKQPIRTAYFMTSRSCCKNFYNEFLREITYQGLKYNFRSLITIDVLTNIQTNGSVTFWSVNDDDVEHYVSGHEYDIVHIDTKIDQNLHDKIRLSLKQNAVIPRDKQIQFFDIEQDKVWFEKEYKDKCFHDALAQIWVGKQPEPHIKRKQMGIYDQYLTSGLVLEMINSIDNSIRKELLTKDKREDEEPMSNFAINVEVGKIRVPAITNVEIIVPDKVVKVSFTDGTDMKMVCHEEDTFDLRRCLFIAIAKKLYKDRYTWEGIEHKATELSYLKAVTKVVDKALKDFNNKIKEAEKEAKKIADKKRAAENQKRKHAEYVKRRDERRQKEIDEKNRQQFEYDVAVQVEAARRIAEMYNSDWDGK